MSHRRATEDQRRLRKLYQATFNHWYSLGPSWDEEHGRYKRWYRTPGAKKFLRARSNRVARRAPGLYQRGEYRKTYDYRWNLW